MFTEADLEEDFGGISGGMDELGGREGFVAIKGRMEGVELAEGGGG